MKSTEIIDRLLPFPVQNELESTVPVRSAELDLVCTRGAGKRRLRGTGVGVEHRKLQLQVTDAAIHT
jgi:hypothetical protein